VLRERYGLVGMGYGISPGQAERDLDLDMLWFKREGLILVNQLGMLCAPLRCFAECLVFLYTILYGPIETNEQHIAAHSKIKRCHCHCYCHCLALFSHAQTYVLDHIQASSLLKWLLAQTHTHTHIYIYLTIFDISLCWPEPLVRSTEIETGIWQAIN